MEPPAELNWGTMLADIRAQARFVAESTERIYADVTRALPDAMPRPSRAYLVGCGDSHYCGLATRFAFEAWSGVATDALESLEFSRYLVNYAPSDALVLAVSNSGEVARTVECAAYARARGLRAVGATRNLESRLARTADAVVSLAYESPGFAPGTISYAASLLVLYCAAIRLGELNGRLTSADVRAHLAALAGTAAQIEATVDAADRPVAAVAASIAPEDPIFVIGGGPNWGTTQFASAKLIESASANLVPQELEEWAHEQYFLTRPGTHTFVLAPEGAAIDRAREQLAAVRDVGGRAIAICAAGDRATAAAADVTIGLPDGIDELLSPLVYAVPVQLLGYHVAQHRRTVMLGFDDDRRREVNFRQIFGSAIPELPAGQR